MFHISMVVAGVLQYSYSVATVISDTNLIPANDTWHPKIPNIVYFGMDWLCPNYDIVSALVDAHRLLFWICYFWCCTQSVEGVVDLKLRYPVSVDGFPRQLTVRLS